MSIVNDAFIDLYGEDNLTNYQLNVIYNNRFKPYNANVKLRNNNITFNLSKKLIIN